MGLSAGGLYARGLIGREIRYVHPMHSDRINAG